ncbi:hypothetical protein [Pseudomonas sp. NA-150]|uniref:hypothetical protein n=1 Tax=Pseudomonas sp. NA-150 TaxID=3367525 RepID=UPI0037C6D91B
MMIYDGLAFPTQLHAQWAAFFNLAGWTWAANPASVADWVPDFRVSFDCGHSECSGNHTILISVLPVTNIDGVLGHPALKHCYLVEDQQGRWLADAGAVFGSTPSATRWEMSHGAGGGTEEVGNWVDNPSSLWIQAASAIR